MSAPAIRTEIGPHGEMLHLVPFLPPELPGVSRYHLEQAWEEAREAALDGHPVRLHGFRFRAAGAAPLDLLLTDPDAVYWANGIERIASLSTAYGISLCLRLLALVTLMSSADWMRPWFTLGRAGAAIHPGLLQAAALAPLTPAGGFAETSLRALLPQDDE